MYNPKSDSIISLQNDDNNSHIEHESEFIVSENPSNQPLQTFNHDSVYNNLIYSQPTLTKMGLIEEDNKQPIKEDSYTFNRESQYKDSSNILDKITIESENVFQNAQNSIGKSEIYEHHNNITNVYQPLSTYDPSIFEKINFSEFVGALGKNIDNDTTLPIANISRLMKSVLPNSAKVAKQAKDMIRECVTEFIFFVSSEVSNIQAKIITVILLTKYVQNMVNNDKYIHKTKIYAYASDLCSMERRKTLNADDIFIAMNKLGFEHYDKPLKMYHSKWRKMRDSNIAHNNPRSQ